MFRNKSVAISCCLFHCLNILLLNSVIQGSISENINLNPCSKNWIGKQDEFPVKNMHDFCYERTLLRARFEENKHVTNLAKATELLKGILTCF